MHNHTRPASPLQDFSSGKYVRKGHRRALLRHLAENPGATWPQSNPFHFKNPHK